MIVPMIKIIDIVNWVTTRMFLNIDRLDPDFQDPFITFAGWNDDRSTAG